jgi:uncharacterized protein (TIGR02996 family)
VLTLVITGENRQQVRLAFDEREITFGRVDGNHVVLPDRNISRRHARLVIKDGKYVLVDLKSTNGTYVNGRKLTSPIVVKTTDQIRMGSYSVALEDGEDVATTKERPLAPFIPRDRIEADLLAAIARQEQGAREIYADWLEEHGHAAQAEFVRVQQELADMLPVESRFEATSQRLRELSTTLEFRWRIKLAQPPIETCRGAPAFDFVCPKQWGGLAPTEREDVRFCGACNKHVHYCVSVPEARNHAARGECVALDLRSRRWGNDLEGPYGVETCPSCRSDVGEDVPGRECPRCGGALRSRYMTVGMIA